MDLFAALSIASYIVQLIHNGFKLLSNSKDIYRTLSGVSSEVEALRVIAEHVSSLSNRLVDDSSTASTSHSDPELTRIARECKSIADSILHIVQGLHHGVRKGRWRTFIQAVREAGKHGQLQSLGLRLGGLQMQVNARLMYLMGCSLRCR